MILRRIAGIAIVPVFIGMASLVATGQTPTTRRDVQRDTKSERTRDSQVEKERPQVEKERPLIDPTTVPDSSQTELKQAIVDLMEQIKALNLEVGKLRRAHERDSASLELVLSEDGVSRLEQRLAELQERKQQL